MTNHELAAALRCTSTVHDDELDCSACPFYDKQDLPADLAGKYPEDWLCPCDVDRVSLMAADALENTTAHVAALQKEVDKLRGQLDTVQAQNEQLREANALTIKATTARLCREWISVKEQFPKNDERVLALCKDDVIHDMRWNYPNWEWRDRLSGDAYFAEFVTHWMPLPEAPVNLKAKENEP